MKVMCKYYYKNKIISNCKDILLDLHVQLDIYQEFWNVPHLAWSKFRCAWSEICICNKNSNPTLAKFCAFVLFCSLLIKKYKSKCEDILFEMFIMILLLLHITISLDKIDDNQVMKTTVGLVISTISLLLIFVISTMPL